MSENTRIVLVGAAGRMGLALTRCLHARRVPGLDLVAAVDRADGPGQGGDLGDLAGLGPIGTILSADLAAASAQADVLIDFSFHTASAEHARRAAEWGKALVIGTTGLADDEEQMVRQAAGRVPIVMAPNMSLGVNLLFSLAELAARALKDRGYDAEIIERHHRRKKDAPSGTALGLAAAVARGYEVDLRAAAVHGREGIAEAERTASEIGIHAVRGGDIVGDHTVLFAAEGEMVELSHRATTRDAFAVGALRAAAWVVDRAPGLYTMRDVLGLPTSD